MPRKIREMVLAMRIDAAFSKDKMLELYLNEIFLGENSYGVAAAATIYFGKSLDELTLAQVAFLAALPKAPVELRSAPQPGRRRRPPQLGDRSDGRQRLHHDGGQAAAEAEELVASNRPFGAVVADVDYFVEEVRRAALHPIWRQGAL